MERQVTGLQGISNEANPFGLAGGRIRVVAGKALSRQSKAIEALRDRRIVREEGRSEGERE